MLNKYVKFSIAGAIILFITISVAMNYFGYDSKVYDESLKAFNIVEKAYKEDRMLTDYETMELERFGDFTKEWADNADKKGKLSERESNDSGLILTVHKIVTMYPAISDKEFSPDEESLEEFHQKFQDAEILLK